MRPIEDHGLEEIAGGNTPQKLADFVERVLRDAMRTALQDRILG